MGSNVGARSILVVEDEPDLAELLRINLEREGFRCRLAPTGDVALRLIREHTPDLIVIDRMLPGVSGDEVLARIKNNEATARIPVLVLTAKVDETDQLVSFALGADDYVTKPFSMKIFVARAAALLRRKRPALGDAEEITAGHITLVPSRHAVTVSGRPVKLTATEFRLLKVLMLAQERVLARSQIIDALFGTTAIVTDRCIDVHITALRRKLESEAGWIQTIRGVGYTIRQPE